MAGGPAAETIMFIGALLAAGLIAGSLSAVAGELSSGMEARADALSFELRGRFDIVNDPELMPYSDPVLTVYVKNTGTVPFYTGDFAVFIDGSLHSDLTFEIGGASTEEVRPGEVLEIDVNDASGLNGDYLLSIIAGNGYKDSLEITI